MMWKRIPNSEWEISDEGDIRSLEDGSPKRQYDLPSGYKQVSIRIGAKYSNYYVHRLSLAAFVGPCPDGMQVNHIDGDKANNRSGNLEYVTPRENNLHAYRLGLKDPAPAVAAMTKASQKLTEEEVLEIRRRYDSGDGSHHSLGREYGVTHACIGAVVTRKSWRHLP